MWSHLNINVSFYLFNPEVRNLSEVIKNILIKKSRLNIALNMFNAKWGHIVETIVTVDRRKMKQ